MYSVSKVKNFIGREGHGYNCNLLLNGKVVAFVYDDASGGPVNYDWADRDAKRVQGESRSYDDSINKYDMNPHEAAFEKFVIGLPKYKSYGKMSCMTADVYIGELLMLKSIDDRIGKMLKSKIVLVMDGKLAHINIPKGMAMPATFGPVKAKYPKAQVLNELPLEEAFAIARPLLAPKDPE